MNKVCLSYSVDAGYLDYVKTSISSLNTTSPGVYAHVDLINCNDTNFDNFKNTIIKNTKVGELLEKNHVVIKNKHSEILKERFVKLTGAYANLRKVYNIYHILNDYDFDYVINMDADNIITKNLMNFFSNLNKDSDLLLKYASKEKLVGEKLEKRYFNFKDFDISKLDLDNLDVHFREGCLVVCNTDASKDFFKFVSNNILEKIAWYGDSYWITRSYLNFKDNIKIKELPNNFVNYNISNDNTFEPYVVSGYGSNKHSGAYAKIAKTYA
jgi:hypothetical protein